MSLKPSIYSPKRGSISKSKSIFKSILFNLDSVRSGCPISRAPVLNSRAFRIELEFRNVGFCGGGKTGVPTRRKTSRSREENQQQTQPTYDVESGNRTRATLVEGECSHHCAIPAPPTEGNSFPHRTKKSAPAHLILKFSAYLELTTSFS